MQLRSLILFIAAVAVALLLSGFVVKSHHDTQRAADFVIHTQEVISAVGRARSHFNRVISAHRGFLLEGDRLFLPAIEQSEQLLDTELMQIERRVQDNADQMVRVERLRELMATLLPALGQQRRDFEASGVEPEQPLPTRRQTQRWVRLFEAITVEEERLLAERRAHESLSRARSEWLVGGLVLLLIGLLALAIWRVRSELRARDELHRLTSDMARKNLDQERLRTVLEATPSAILMVDGRGQVVLVNAELERLFGYPRSELLGQPIEMLLPERVRGTHVAFRENFLRNAEVRPMGAGRDLFGRRRDGSEIPIEIGLSPLHTNEGLFVLAAVTDISLRKRSEAIIAQRAVEMATQRFDMTQAEALALFNTETERQKVLDGLLALLAGRHPFPVLLFYAYEEIGGLLRLGAAHAPPPHVVRELRVGEGLVGAAAADRRLLVVDQLGDASDLTIAAGFAEFRPAALLFCPVVFRDRLLGVLALAACDAVSDSERAFVERLGSQLGAALHNLQQYEDLQLLADQLRARGEEIEHKNLQLEVANRMKSEFLANMSHELRTPLNAIIGFAEVLAAGLAGEVGDEQREYLNDIHQAGRHLLALINDILDLSKVEAGKIELELEPFDASELGAAALSVVKEKALAHGIQLSARVDEDLGVLLLDPRKAKQIVYNLLANAVKFSAAGGRVELSLRRVAAHEVAALPVRPGRRLLLEPVREVPHFLEIAVSDEGIGIEAADLERLFEPFTQVDSSLARRHTGAGLGLAMVRRLTEKHGGRLMVESAPGQGSRFVVWLPWRLSDAGDDETPSRKELSLPVASRLLLLDVEPARCRALCAQLQAEGFAVVVASAFEEAVDELVQRGSPDAIVVNVARPDLGGWNLLSQLKQQQGLIGSPVVIVAAEGELPGDCALGADDVLVKPVGAEQLRDALQRAGVGGAGAEGRAAQVMVVDDDPRAVSLLTTLLRGAGMEPLSAYGGREALTLIRSRIPDLIVLDLMMPDLSGLEVAAALRRDAATAEIPIVMVTAKWLSPEEHRLLAGSVDQVMQKSMFSGAGFISEVQRVLQRRQVRGRSR